MTKILVDKAVLNQCDGCMQGAAMRGIYHIDKNGKSFMTCQKSKYMCPQPHRQPLTEDERQDVYAKAIKAINNDQNLSWRDAIVFETERAHGIGGEK